MHLGHSIFSCDRAEIGSLKNGVCELELSLVISPLYLQNILFQKYCCVSYESPFCPFQCTMVK